MAMVKHNLFIQSAQPIISQAEHDVIIESQQDHYTQWFNESQYITLENKKKLNQKNIKRNINKLTNNLIYCIDHIVIYNINF